LAAVLFPLAVAAAVRLVAEPEQHLLRLRNQRLHHADVIVALRRR